MTARRLDVGVIGAGWWAAEAHLPALARHPRAHIAGIQTRSAAKAESLTAAFGVLPVMATAEELLALPDLDAVVIASTPHVHYAQARAALERGLHVLIEKPMTLRAAESAELVDLAARKGVQFLISCPWHYTRHAELVRERIAAGGLGQIRLVSMFMTNFTLGFYEARPFVEALAGSDGVNAAVRPLVEPHRGSYADPAVAGGGQIYCQASHSLAYLGFLTGLEPLEVSARFQTAGTAVDATDVLHVAFAGGSLASIGTAATHADVERFFEVRIIGTQGVASLELWKGTCRIRTADGRVEEPSPLAEDEIYPKEAPATNLVDAALGLAPNRSPATLGHYAMRLIEAACVSADQRRAVTLTPEHASR
jgi:predicted dehydrogenase